MSPTSPDAISNRRGYKLIKTDANGIWKEVILYMGKAGATLGSPEYLQVVSDDTDKANYISFIETHLREIFSDVEMSYARENFPKMKFSTQQIHKDDTIRIIKKKLLRDLGEDNIAYSEIYLYGKTTETVNLLKFFYEKTKDDDLLTTGALSSRPIGNESKLTKNMIGQLFMNLDTASKEIEDSTADYFSYDDILPHIKDGVEMGLAIPLGQKFANYFDLLFSPNPYDVLPSEQPTFQYSAGNSLMTFENHLLLSYGEIVDKTIYFCLTEDVFRYASDSGIPDGYMLRLYYPLLAKDGILSKADFDRQRGELINNNKEILRHQMWNQYEIVDSFYDIYNVTMLQSAPRSLPYTRRGISSFKIVLHPEFQTEIPLEYLFKQFHATQHVPFVKYNPGVRKENIYRIYSAKSTRSGKKIPYLSKSKITSFAKHLGKSRQVSMYVLHQINENVSMDIFIDFDHNGNISVRSEEYAQVISTDELNHILLTVVNSIIIEINQVLQQSGYQLNVFENIAHKLVEIEAINYVYHLTLSDKNKDVFQKKYTSCLSPIFDILDIDATKGAQMRFKRVENYRKMDAMSAMITRIYNTTNSEKHVVQALMTNFTLTEQEALVHITKYLNEFIQIQGRYVNKSTEFVDNPGAAVHFQYSSGKRELYIDVIGLTNVEYIDTIGIYLDGFMRMSQAPETAPEIISSLIKNCQKKVVEKEEEERVENVIPAQPDMDKMNIVNEIQPIQFGKKVDTLFLNNEYDEDEDEKEGLDFDEDEDEDEGDGKLFFEDEGDGDEEEDDKLFFGDEEEDGGDEEEDNGDDDDNPKQMIGRGRKTTRDVADDSNTFYRKMRNFEPTLFLSTEEKPYGAYSRVCPANISRQPVILTQDEKQKIDREHPGSYTNALEYGTNPDKKFWYICPRYWCTTSNTSITETEYKNGVCSGNVHEFTDNAGYHKDSNGNYVPYSPGFMKKEQHPKGYCIPCCFKNWNSKSQIDLREKCGITSPTEKKPKKKEAAFNYYIMGQYRFPLPEKRWGYLPLVVELFLRTDNSESMDKKNNAQLVENMPTLLRYGVEQSSHQSFLACIADIYGFSKNKTAITIDEMRTTLSNSVTLDNYLRYHNGSLASIFQPKKYQLEEETLTKHYASDFYKSIDMSKIAQRAFFEDTVASFENFKKFITDKDSFIDHTYIWDFISMPNPLLFPNGVNLVILEIVDNDITDNIQLICPTNSYSDTLFDPKKQTVILLKNDRHYEPIYLLTDNTQSEGKIKVLKWFDYTAIDSIKTVLAMIQKTTQRHCLPLESMPRVYKFKKNVPVNTVYKVLTERGHDIESQVSNYRGKIIGVIVDSIYLPCFPSIAMPNLKTIYTDDVIWRSYVKTRDFLQKIHTETSHQIMSKPMLKVVEDELIVGILTETNQFVQIDPPIPNDIEDGIPDIKGENYMLLDKVFATSKSQDKTRIETTVKIRLETQFYVAFRSTIRIILNNRENREIREKIMGVLGNQRSLYRKKLTELEKLLRHLCKDAISFGDIPSELLENMVEISSCFGNCSDKKYCIMKENSDCSLLIPKNNLLNNKDNEVRYFLRMADELLRYHRVRLFMLDNKKYLNITSFDYQIRGDEFIILQTLLMGDYFDDMVPFEINSYVKNIPYEYATPFQSQKYSNTVSLTTQEVDDAEKGATNPDYSNDSIKERLPSVQGNATNQWVRMFPQNVKEVVLTATRTSTFFVVIGILQEKLKRTVTIHDVLRLLWEAYSPYIETHRDIIFKLLSKQGKKSMIDRVKKNQATLEDLMMSQEYFLTDFDLWVLASSKLNLPIVLFSSTKINMLESNTKWLLLGGEIGDSYYFVRSPTEYLRRDTRGFPSYQFITPSLKFMDVKGFSAMIQNPSYIDNTQSIDTFLSGYGGVGVDLGETETETE